MKQPTKGRRGTVEVPATQQPDITMKIQIHRYCNKVALSIDGQPTVYLDRTLSAELAGALIDCNRDIVFNEFSKSRFESRELTSAPAKQFPLQPGDELSKLEPLAFEGHPDSTPGHPDNPVLLPPKPLPWHVVTVSTNTGSFGHKSVLVIREDGEGRELLLQAYGGDKLPVRGDVLEVLPASEVPPRKLPTTTPEIAKSVISTLK